MRGFLRSQAGAILVEYQLVIVLVAVVCIAALAVIGGQVSDLFGLLHM